MAFADFCLIIEAVSRLNAFVFHPILIIILDGQMMCGSIYGSATKLINFTNAR
jgi:hypothetical protein